MDYNVLKTLHILSATILFGTGLGTAYFMWSAARTRDTHVIAAVAQQVVRADWLFTMPTVIFQALSGAWLVHIAAYPWNGWVGLSLGLYTLAGLCWLPVVWLQIRMRNTAQAAVLHHAPLPQIFWRDMQRWFWLGVPAFAAMLGVFFLMVFKRL